MHQPNKLVIKLQPEDGLELHLLAARARAPATRWRRCSSTSISTRPSPRTASAPTSACCSTPSPAAQPVRAQRRAGGGLALGRARARRLGQDTGPRPCMRPAAPHPAAASAGRRATASPGPKKCERHARSRRIKGKHRCPASAAAAGPSSASPGCCWPTARLRHAAGGRALRARARQQSRRWCASAAASATTAPADFKRKLAGSVNEACPSAPRAVDEDDKTADIIVKVIDNAVERAAEIPQRRRQPRLERAPPRWPRPASRARRIEFTAWATRASWRDAQHKFFRLGVHAAAIVDSHVQVMSATMLSRATAR